MSAIPEIRHRLRVVADTRKITRAMYLISSAKMQKALRMHERNSLYFHRVRSDIRFIIDNSHAQLGHPYFQHRLKKSVAFLVISGDKGMCGAYNEDVLRLARRTIEAADCEQVSIFTIGQTAAVYFHRLGMQPDVQYLHISQNPMLASSREITQELCDLYEQGMVDEVYLIYTHMYATTDLRPTVLRLLPILAEDFADVEILHRQTAELTYHPSEAEVLQKLVPQYLIGLTYTACVQAYASEHCARMTAMDASTRNADDMLGRLRLDLNRARQGDITQELTEIVAGANSVSQ
ncbi:MAG: ATP synthase F1 subunit gamma [Oscillospiraceae bacterium]|jgi:F-type H+-transporting ATPase subunit gamma|nr:ATP synthase F1 subunit gamma [Oscillospiraceae bacterium]